jgi:hypothetical protein
MPGAVNPPQTPRRVSRSGFHAWLRRPPSKHPQEGERLKVAIRAAHEKPGGAMAPKDCTKSCKTKALLSDTTGWRDYGGRWAGMEKRGGVRMIYYLQREDGEIWLLLIYARNVQENVPAHVLQQLRKEIDDADD